MTLMQHMLGGVISQPEKKEMWTFHFVRIFHGTTNYNVVMYFCFSNTQRKSDKGINEKDNSGPGWATLYPYDWACVVYSEFRTAKGVLGTPNNGL